MSISHRRWSAAQASRALGVSAKALRIYEDHGLLRPERSEAGYRLYAETDLERARTVVQLRTLGLSLAQVAAALQGDAQAMQLALAARLAELEDVFQHTRRCIDQVKALRAGMAAGRPLPTGNWAGALQMPVMPPLSFALPWPWNGEWFELAEVRRLNYIVGPLGSGKTRLMHCIAAALPGCVYLDEDRQGWEAPGDAPGGTTVDAELAWLCEEGAIDSPALRVLVQAVAGEKTHVPLVVEMIENGLDHATQEALVHWLRRRARQGAQGEGAPVFIMTRSSAILDLDLVGPHETIVLCPANHTVPQVVAPYGGAAGYEALASCLATPAARARLAAGPLAT
ncbi:putative transcriptional regulator [Acidovorax sp. CF316]|uniref:MerR family transcriptional regulator n=1 Tax=Acidovorax sp. CF316 TaxID=1144317 RepID=UPI00026BC7C5|nr:MerR family transcriptional regulator [Acidovorax sp. CF316]EJE50142.1 putative transcriptional regulator [Acidovorax sp. CF316]